MDHFTPDAHVRGMGDETAANRARARDSLLLAARLRSPALKGERQVRVRNLSAGGLMAELAEPIEIGAPVEVEMRGVGKVRGRIAWIAAGRIGIAFDHRIDPMKARKPVVTPPQQIIDKPIRPLL